MQFGPWSEVKIAAYNNGYGTFDMKSYNADTVYQVLSWMKPRGFVLYQEYFILDYLFIPVYGIFQTLLLYNAFHWCKIKALGGLIPVVPIARGLCDLFENTSLLYILRTYPVEHEKLVNFTAKITSLKLNLITAWIVLLFLGYIIKAVIKIKGNHAEKI